MNSYEKLQKNVKNLEFRLREMKDGEKLENQEFDAYGNPKDTRNFLQKLFGK